MNPYIQNLNRIEFLITLACTGRCKHCSEGEHVTNGVYIDSDAAVQVVNKLCTEYNMESLMTFGGEPLLYPDVVCKIHAAAREMNIPKRQLITNGFFSKDEDIIKITAMRLAQCGVNDILLSVDAFHQEFIPLKPVKDFANAIQVVGISLRAHPAWLVNKNTENPYNQRTHEILKQFKSMGITASEGNNIIPDGNAIKYLSEYYDLNQKYISPYAENPRDVRSICISPNGDVLGGNIYQSEITDIIKKYVPED